MSSSMNFYTTYKPFLYLVLIGIFFSSCRGSLSHKEPIHPNPNMDLQPKKEAQRLSRIPPQNTVPWGNTANPSSPSRQQYHQTNTAFYHGKTAAPNDPKNGSFVKRIPIPVNRKLIMRGKERFNIYCATCHDRAGTGNSIVVARGIVQPVNLSDKRIVDMTDGEIFSIITYGVRTMPSYAKKISHQDRWAIIAYLRALQLTRNATLQDVPPSKRKELR